jgi:hypothetical protein
MKSSEPVEQCITPADINCDVSCQKQSEMNSYKFHGVVTSESFGRL